MLNPVQSNNNLEALKRLEIFSIFSAATHMEGKNPIVTPGLIHFIMVKKVACVHRL